MTTLTGTEKQIAWATDIRAGKMEKWAALIAERNASTRERSQMIARVIGQIVNTLSEASEASIWIDGRNNVSQMLNEMGILIADASTRYDASTADLRDIYSMMNEGN